MRLRFSLLSLLVAIALGCAGLYSVYANEDLGTTLQACTIIKDVTEPVTNGSCFGTKQFDGTQTVHSLVNGDGEHHDEFGECVAEGEGTWVKKECAPTYTCKDNTAVDLANAAFISAHEQPYENAPEVNLPIFPLAQDFLKDIVFADNHSVADTANGCEYTCNDGYRMVSSTCTATGGTTTATTVSCTVAPTFTIAAPTGTNAGTQATATLNATATVASIVLAGSGYTGDPAVTLTGGTCNFYPNVKATVNTATGVISNITVSATGVTATATSNATGTTATVVGGGSGYITTPMVTVMGGNCTTRPTATATIDTTTKKVTGITLTGAVGCSAAPVLVIADPTGVASCTAAPTLTIAPPSGTTAGTAATVTATVNGTNLVVNVTNAGSGYTTVPNVTITGGTCATPVSATATIDTTTKKVTGIVLSTTGTTATATSNAAGTTATIVNHGSGYTTAPIVTVTGNVCTTLPTAVATVASGAVTAITLSGGNACTAAPTLTVAPPVVNNCNSTGSIKKCQALVCTGTVPSDAQYCTDDTKINGHEDVARVRRADAGACTDPQKCEWYCPSTKPVYCELQNTCAKTLDECACPAGQQQCSDGTCAASCNNTCATSAPSQLKTNIDQPLIQCAAVDNTKTHFRYKITKTGGTSADTFISDLYTVGTTVKHTGPLATGTYTVTCLYGTSASTDATAMQIGTCTKPMEVKDTGDVQGCSRIYGYKGNTLSDDMWNATTFDASFRCGSRIASTGITNPYRLMIGTQTPAYLQYDKVISDLFNGIAIGPVSTQTQNYTFSSSTDAYCAVKVGDGYSTNNSCRVRACVGAECSTPQTFIITPSSNAVCTDRTDFTYDIGCNEDSTDYTQCVAWLYSSTAMNRTVKVKVNGADQDRVITCTSSTPAGALGPVKTCVMTLPTGGMPVTVFSGDNNSFQTTLYTLSRDTQSPTGTLEYFTNYSAGTKLDATQYDLWQRQPITAVITCTDQPGTSDGSSCSCAPSLKNDTNGIWSLGVRSTNASIGPDIMKYSRVLNNSTTTTPYAVTVYDTAGNIGPAYTPDIGVDTVPPKVTASISNTTVTLNVSDSADGGSGLWKPNNGIPVGVNKNPPTSLYPVPAILYRIGLKSNQAALEFGTTCISPSNNLNYYHRNEAGVNMSQSFSVDIGSQTGSDPYIIAYCIEDNAGNVTRGVYPSDPVGCFSSTNMNPVPTVTTYKTPLQASMTANQYGYSLSENATNATCFRGILSNNVTTLVTNQYNASNANTLNWSTPATLKNTSTPNTNGYYYFSTIAGNTLSINNTPTGTGSKAVIVEGGNIQINSNIDYSGTDKTLILIARKNTTTNVGGNIYINPSVTRIDAIIIADGALINATTAITGSTSTTTTKNWIDNPSELSNRLTINGRIYSFNTRGGSLTTSGSKLVQITTNTGRVFDGSTLTTSATPSQAAAVDLERLRVILNDGNALCTTQVNYDTLAGSSLPTLLQKPAGYTGGTCSF